MATVDTSDLEKQLSVLNANLHQAETIKTRLEQQMDNLDVTDIHYDKKITIEISPVLRDLITVISCY